MNYKRPESVIIFVFAGQRLLLLKRQQPLYFWQAVTGSLHWNETAESAAGRELAEETGVKPAFLQATGQSWSYPIHPAWRERYAPDVIENKEHVFIARLPAAIRIQLSAEHSDYRWCLWPTVKNLLSVSFHKKIFQRFRHASPCH